MKNIENEYEKQAREFAERVNLTMNVVYLGHYPRLSKHITANFRVTLMRPGKTPFGFDYSTSINDSWRYREGFKSFKGLPNQINLDKFFEGYLIKPVTTFRQYYIEQYKKSPSLYDVLACLTKYNPGTFSEFCADYGYSDDSITANKTYLAVIEEWKNVERMFNDVIDELREIN